MGMPAAVVSTNRFGNVIVRGVDDRYYRIIPESLDCLPFATSEAELLANMNDDAFILDWEMKRLVEKAEAALGVLSKGRVYYLVVPSVLGGSYSEQNIRTITIEELLYCSGDIAQQIEGLPPGAKVKMVVTNSKNA
jgi:hypothetical protein